MLNGIRLLVLWGGPDIGTELYGQDCFMAGNGKEAGIRDLAERRVVDEAIKQGIPILGICRGAQLLCALDGGTLWQHVNNHEGKDHAIQYKDEVVWVNSGHHQMMRPSKHAQILATTTEVLSKKKYADSYLAVESKEPEVEIAYFPELNALGIQAHPEWDNSKNSPLNLLTRHLVKEYLRVDLG
jgi:putative glutamine amidotransferase